MPRRNKRDPNRSVQHPRGAKRPRSYHRQSKSPGLRKQIDFLERTWQPPEEKAA